MDDQEKFKSVFSTWCQQSEDEYKDTYVFLNFHPNSPESKLLTKATQGTNVFYMSVLEGDGKTYSAKFYLCGKDGARLISKADVFRRLFVETQGTDSQSTSSRLDVVFKKIAADLNEVARLGVEVNAKDRDEVTRKYRAFRKAIMKLRPTSGQSQDT